MSSACSDGSGERTEAATARNGFTSTPAQNVAEAAALLIEPDRLARMSRLAVLLDSLPAEQFPELARMLEALPVVPRMEDVGLVMHAWARRDPEAAYEQALDWVRRKVKWRDPIPSYVAAEVVYVWSQDPLALVDEYLGDAPGSLKGALEGSMLRGWAASGQIKRATRYLEHQIQLGGTSQVYVTLFAERLVQREGVEAAIEWAESLQESKLRKFAFRRTAEVIARVDPPRAIAWVEEHLGEPDAWGMARRVARSWGRRGEAAEALAWVDATPLDDERQSAIEWTYEDWVKRDRDAAMAWARNRAVLETSLRRHLWPHMRSLVKRDPSEAIEWVRGFADADTRADLEMALAHMWLQEDREAAEVWIRDEGLEEAVAASAAQRAKRREETMRKPVVELPTMEGPS